MIRVYLIMMTGAAQTLSFEYNFNKISFVEYTPTKILLRLLIKEKTLTIN